MSFDFNASQIRTTQIIASGSKTTTPAIMIYGSGSATSYTGAYTADVLSKVGTDTFLFVSGTIGKRGVSGAKALTLFGGDTITSGSVTALLGLSGSLTRLSDGSPYLVAGSNVTITSASNGQITISSTGGGTPSDNSNFWFDFPNAGVGKIYTTGSVAIGLVGSSDTKGNDVFFFTSGTIGGRGVTGTTVFGGDLVTSGSSFVLNGVNEVISDASSAIIRLQSSGKISNATMTTAGDLSLRNAYTGGSFILGVTPTGGSPVNAIDLRVGTNEVNTKFTILRQEFAGGGAANPFNATDTNFFVGGFPASKGGTGGGTSVFGGDLLVSGSTYIGNSSTNFVYVNAKVATDIIPDGNRTRNLGSDTARFANVYTGDLHLKNERGDYTLIEEEDCLTIRFNKTGKRYKFVLEPAPEYDNK
jgi:hypothetical protein